MSLKLIEDFISTIIQTREISDDSSLDGFCMDADHYFGNHPAFLDVEVKVRPQYKECVISIEVKISDAVSSLQEISHALNDVWLEIHYRDFQASSCEHFFEATVFRFVTGVDFSLLVTGEVVATGANYTDLVKIHERDFWFAPALRAMSERENNHRKL